MNMRLNDTDISRLITACKLYQERTGSEYMWEQYDDLINKVSMLIKTTIQLMKILFAFLATLFLANPAWAVDVMMGANGNLVFEPAEVTIAAGESVHFVNNMLPPHNVVVEDHPEISHEGLAMMPGEEFDVTFAEAGDYTYWCGPHKGAGMIGTVHVE